jgi:hypothetical protein
VSADSTSASSDTRSPLYQRDSNVANLSLARQHSAWSPANPSALLSTKGKQPASTPDNAKQPFLFILFDREDYLREISDHESDGEAEAARDVDGLIDPRILAESRAFDPVDGTSKSPGKPSRIQQSSPKKAQAIKIRTLTHLSSRQPIVKTLRIHPNFNLRNLFGNMPFSSSILTNNYPPHIQDIQVNNLFLPTWAMMTVNTRPDPGSLKSAFYNLFGETSAMLASGTPAEAIIEVHPNIAALFDEEEYYKSGVLSKWAAGIVHSSRLKGTNVIQGCLFGVLHPLYPGNSVRVHCLCYHRGRFYCICLHVYSMVLDEMDDIAISRNLRAYARVAQTNVS